MNKILRLAIETARHTEPNKYRVVAIVTDHKNRVLSIGCNSFYKTHPKQAWYAEKMGEKKKIYLHAEIDAIVKAKKIPSKIYVARVDRKGIPRLAKPCPICSCAIKDSNIKEIYYTK